MHPKTFTPVALASYFCACYSETESRDELETVFLPMKMKRKIVLVHTDGNRWRLDNSKFKNSGPGLAYRRSKHIDDKRDDFATWGSLVDGTDTGDGWLQTQVQSLSTG